MAREADSADSWVQYYMAQRCALTAYAVALTGNAADAADLIQEVLLRLLRSGPTPDNRRAYVMRCLRSVAATRRRRRTTEAIDGLDPAFLDAAIGDVEQRETVGRVQAALRGLPPPQREAIVLRVYGELTLQEAAEALERPIGSVASAYARGMAALRETLGTEHQHVRRSI